MGARPTARWAVPAVLAVLLVSGGCGWLEEEPREPGQLTFYRPATVLDAGTPGEVLEQQPLDLDPSVPGTAWRIRYVSTTPAGDLVPVTGVLLRPDGDPPEGGFPVVAYGHGTVGLGDQCAPSRQEPFQAVGIREMLDAGYIVAASDYEGLGIADETHPYLVGAASGHNLLDAARAARVADGGDDVVVVGLSQGGHAALFARTLAPTYAPELDVHGVAAAAPVTNVAVFLLPGFTDPQLFPFLAEAVLSWSEVYEEPNLDDLFVVEDAEAARLARDDACTEDLEARRPLDEIIRDEPANIDHWVTAVTENSPVAGSPGIPVLLTHGDADPLVPIAGTLAYRDELCASGEAVHLIRDPSWVHVSAWVETLPDILTWIGDRFAEAPPPDDCR